MSDPKNLLEALALLKACGVQAKAAMADKKLDVRDLPIVVALWNPAKAALEDASKIAEEVKALDMDGATKVIEATVEVVNVWVDVFSAA